MFRQFGFSIEKKPPSSCRINALRTLLHSLGYEPIHTHIYIVRQVRINRIAKNEREREKRRNNQFEILF